MRHKIGTNEPNFLLVCTHAQQWRRNCITRRRPIVYFAACQGHANSRFSLTRNFRKNYKGASSYFSNVAILLICCIEKERLPSRYHFPKSADLKKSFLFLPPPGLLREKGGRKEQGRIIPHCQLAIRKSDLCSFL